MRFFSDNRGIQSFDFLKQVNPVVNSAKGSLLMLKNANVKEAVDFYNRFHFPYEEDHKKTALQKQLAKCFALNQEIRYRSLNYYIEKCNFSTVIDLGCGYSPRSFYFKSNEKIKYIGIDLPALMHEIRIVGNEINYVAADMTNLASLEKALTGVSGKILIVTESVMSYFTESELKTVIQNIKFLLQKHSGLWITPDFYKNDYITAVLKPNFEKGEFEQIYAILNSSRKTNVGTDIRGENEVASKNGLKILQEEGFQEKQLSFIPSDLTFPFLDSFPEEAKKGVLQNYKNFFHSVLYLDKASLEAAGSSETMTVGRKKGFSFTISQNHENFTIFLQGRLDTISSPELLSFYDNSINGRKDKHIIIDCSKLEYVSSAGLRVFLLMYKGTNGNMSLVNTNEIVRNILSETGFGEYFLKKE